MKQKHFQKRWLLYWSLAVLIWQPYNSSAQSVKRECISSYGSVTLVENISIMQTGGQSYYTTSSSETQLSILQGFQQPNTFSIEEINPISLKSLNVSVFPNPASYTINIQSTEEIAQSYIQVVDINGKYVFLEKILNLSQHNINCESWTSGVYFITIRDSEQNSKSLKLIINK